MILIHDPDLIWHFTINACVCFEILEKDWSYEGTHKILTHLKTKVLDRGYTLNAKF